MKTSGTITKGGVHPSGRGKHQVVRDPGTKGAKDSELHRMPKTAPHLQEKKESAHKSGKYGEAATALASGPAATKGTTAQEQKSGKSMAERMYPKKLGLRGAAVD